MELSAINEILKSAGALLEPLFRWIPDKTKALEFAKDITVAACNVQVAEMQASKIGAIWRALFMLMLGGAFVYKYIVGQLGDAPAADGIVGFLLFGGLMGYIYDEARFKTWLALVREKWDNKQKEHEK